MTFTLDNRNTDTLTTDSRSSSATFTGDSVNNYSITWNLERVTWASELRTWGQLVSQLTLDTRH